MTAQEIAGDVLHHDDVPGPDGAPVLVCVHGFLLSASSYADVVRELPAYRHVVPDLRGHGRSAGVSDHATLSRMADDVWALAAHLRLGRFVVIGHSMGSSSSTRRRACCPVWASRGCSSSQARMPPSRLPTRSPRRGRSTTRASSCSTARGTWSRRSGRLW